MNKLHNKKQKCDVDNCDSYARARGWCTKHYGRYLRHGDPLTCYRRPITSNYVTIDNILNDTGTYSKKYDDEILREHFSDIYNLYDHKNQYV